MKTLFPCFLQGTELSARHVVVAEVNYDFTPVFVSAAFRALMRFLSQYWVHFTGTSLEVPEGDLTDIVQIKMAIAAKYLKTSVHDQVRQRTEVTQAQCYLTWTPYG